MGDGYSGSLYRQQELKTIALPFPEEFSGVESLTTAEGIKYINSRYEYEKSALSPTPTKAKGKDAHTITAASGRCGDYTTAAARNQEEE